jgi:integrase
MATITKVARKTGDAYKAVIRLRGIKPFSKTFRRKTDARAWAERMERNIEEARIHGNDHARTLTLKELVREYIDQYTGNNHSVYGCLEWWVREYGDLKLTEITRQTVRDGIKSLEIYSVNRKDKNGEVQMIIKQRAPATLNRYKSALSAVFEFGKEEFDLHENPCRQVKSRTENNHRIRFLTDSERESLLAACRKSDWPLLYLLVLMAITTGARQGELLRLRWGDVNLSSRRAHVRQSKNGEQRILPLTDSVIDILRTLPRPIDSETLLFRASNNSGKPFEFRKHWNRAVKEATINNFRFHDLRHTCASYLAQNGATLLQIADVLGHKQMEVTKRYAHLCVDHKQSLVDQVLGAIK